MSDYTADLDAVMKLPIGPNATARALAEQVLAAIPVGMTVNRILAIGDDPGIGIEFDHGSLHADFDCHNNGELLTGRMDWDGDLNEVEQITVGQLPEAFAKIRKLFAAKGETDV